MVVGTSLSMRDVAVSPVSSNTPPSSFKGTVHGRDGSDQGCDAGRRWVGDRSVREHGRGKGFLL